MENNHFVELISVSQSKGILVFKINEIKQEGNTVRKTNTLSDNKKNILSSFNSFPDDKILYWSKLKQIADDILKCI